MKKIFALLSACTVLSCKLIDQIKPKSSNKELITNHTWKINVLKDEAGIELDPKTMSVEVQSLYNIDFNFKANQIVKASDRVSRQILNQGTWAVTEDGKLMNIELLEFDGDFDVIKISQKVFTIKYLSDKKFAGLGRGIQLQMVPVEN